MTRYFKRDLFSKIIVILCLAALLWLSLGVLLDLDASMTLTQTARLCLWLLIVVLCFSGRRLWQRPDRWFVATCVVLLVMFPFYTIFRIFGRVDIMSVLFHLDFGIEGVSLGIFDKEIREALIAAILIVFATYGLSNLIHLKKVIYIGVMAVLLFASPVVIQSYQMLARLQNPIALHTYLIDPVIAVPQLKPDIILVYLEGIERAFADIDRYGDLFAPVTRFEENALSFTRVHQMEGTGWSLAGLVATMCGVPTVPTGLAAGNGFTERVNFMPDRICLGDVTQQAGYQNKFVVGDDKEFGGINHFLNSHGIKKIVDRPVMEEMVSPIDIAAADANGWVLDDQMTFDIALDVYAQAIEKSDPMMLSIMAFGPHGSTATISRGCSETGVSILAPDIESAVSCTLAETERFLSGVEQLRNGRPTIVVLMSDHFSHDRSISKRLRPEERSNTLVLKAFDYVPPTDQMSVNVSKPSSMVDVYPTLLAFAGFSPAGGSAGLGRSLFRQDQTLIEQYGLAAVNANIFPNKALSDAIWGLNRD